MPPDSAGEEDDKEEESHQTQPLQFDSSDDDDVPLMTMGKRSRVSESETTPEGKKRKTMTVSDDESSDEMGRGES